MMFCKINKKKLPNHIAFIIDGNGRWAKKRGMPRSFGHKVGMDTLISNINRCYNLGINIISVYCFSTENWNRPKEEVDYLMQLFEDFMRNDLDTYINNKKVKLQIMGDYTKFNDTLIDLIKTRLDSNSDDYDYILNLGLNYGGRDEIINAVNNIIKNNHKDVNKELFEKYLYTNNLPDPDFIVRTSGELRLSNFMLWQHAYSELYFSKVHWPAFNNRQLKKSLLSYQKRNRRFGSIKEKK